MKRILPAATMLTMVGVLASCTSTPEPVITTPTPSTPAAVDTPAPVVTATGAAPTDTVITGSTSTGTDTTASTDSAVSTGTTSIGSTPTVPNMTVSGTTDSTPSAPAPMSSAVVHTKTVTYTTPAGKDDVEFSVTTADGKITAVSVTPKASNDVSKMLQGKFKDAVVSEVIGKEISKLNLKAVGGASLTTGAFTQYINSL